MKFIFIFILSLFCIISWSCSSINTLSSKDNFKFIDKVVDNPDYLNSLNYDEDIKIGNYSLNWYLMPNKSEIISLLKEFFDKDYKKEYKLFYERKFYSIRDSAYYSEIAITNSNSRCKIRFRFIQVNKKWYLIYLEHIGMWEKYIINEIFDWNDLKRNDSLFVDNLNMINKIINDSNYYDIMITEGKQFEKYFLIYEDYGDQKGFETYRKYLKTLQGKKYTIKGEKRFATIDDSLMNHRLCLDFESGESLFISLVAINGKWYIENLKMYCYMYPFNGQTTY